MDKEFQREALTSKTFIPTLTAHTNGLTPRPNGVNSHPVKNKRHRIKKNPTRRELLYLAIGCVCLTVGVMCLIIALPRMFVAPCPQQESLETQAYVSSELGLSQNKSSSSSEARQDITYMRNNYRHSRTQAYGINFAKHKGTFASSRGENKELNVTLVTDGHLGYSFRQGDCYQTGEESSPYILVDLGRLLLIQRVVLLVPDDCCGGKLRNFEVRIGQMSDTTSNTLCQYYRGSAMDVQTDIHCDRQIYGRYVSVQILPDMDGRQEQLTMCEMMAFLR